MQTVVKRFRARLYNCSVNVIISRGSVVAIILLMVLLKTADSAAVVPAYIWPLAYIYNRTVPVTPPMMAHGGVRQIVGGGGLTFDGKTGWIDAGDFSGECVVEPATCKKGLSLGLRIKLAPYETDSVAKSFIFDSGGHLGNGVSIYVEGQILFVEIGDSKSLWQASYHVSPDSWHFVLATWSKTKGIFLFVDGPLLTYSDNFIHVESTQTAANNHITIGKGNGVKDQTFGKFSMEMIAVFNEFVPSGKVFMSYSYSPPDQPNGNIRYVNARFVNKGKADIQIYPDRGSRKKNGYRVAKKSSTLLEFVLKEGPLPYGMDFMIRKNETEEVLMLNGKSWLHVDASDDVQVIVVVLIDDDKVQKMIFSTKGVKPNYSPSTETRPGEEIVGGKEKESPDERRYTTPSPGTTPPPGVTNVPDDKTNSMSGTTPSTVTMATAQAQSLVVPLTTDTLNSKNISDASEKTQSNTTGRPVKPSPGNKEKFVEKNADSVDVHHIGEGRGEINQTDISGSDFVSTVTCEGINCTNRSNGSETVLISTKENKNGSYLQDLKILSVIKGNINISAVSSTNISSQNNSQSNLSSGNINKTLSSEQTQISFPGALPSVNQVTAATSTSTPSPLTTSTAKLLTTVSTEETTSPTLATKATITLTTPQPYTTSSSTVSIVSVKAPPKEGNVMATPVTSAPHEITSSTIATTLSAAQTTKQTTATTSARKLTSATWSTSSPTTSSPFTTEATIATSSASKLTLGTWSTSSSTTSSLFTTQTTTAATSFSTTSNAPPTLSTTAAAQLPTTGNAQPLVITPPSGQAAGVGEVAPAGPGTKGSNQMVSGQTSGVPPSSGTAQGGTVTIPFSTLEQLGIVKPPVVQPIQVPQGTQSGKTQEGINWQFKTGGSEAGVSPQTGCVHVGGAHLCSGETVYTTASTTVTAVLPPGPGTTTTTPTSTLTTTTNVVTTTTSTSSTTGTSTTTSTLPTTGTLGQRKTTKPISWRTSPVMTTKPAPSYTKYLTNPSPNSTTTRKPTHPKASFPTPKVPGKKVVNNIYQFPVLQIDQYIIIKCCHNQVVPIPDQCLGKVFDCGKYPSAGKQIKKPPASYMKTDSSAVKLPVNNPEGSIVQPMPPNNNLQNNVLAWQSPNQNIMPYVSNPTINSPANMQLQLLGKKLQAAAIQKAYQNKIKAFNNNRYQKNVQAQNSLLYPVRMQNVKPQYHIPLANLYNVKNMQNKLVYSGNNYGMLGSPQVFNRKSSFLKARTPDEKSTEKLLDDEMLNTIKDVSNGQWLYSDNPKLDNLSPSKLWQNSMVKSVHQGLPLMTSAHLMPEQSVTTKKNLSFLGERETLSGQRGITLLLNEVENGVIKSTPNIKANGNLRKWQGGLKFDGKTAWFDLQQVNVPFLSNPTLATNGFAVAFKLMFDQSISNITEPKYLLDSGGTDGEGVSLFIDNGRMFVMVTVNRKMWQVSYEVNTDEWIYIMLAWDQKDGLFLYVNGKKKASNVQPTASVPTTGTNNVVSVGASRNQEKSSFLLMYLASIDILNSFTDIKAMLGFAPPLVKRDDILTFSITVDNLIVNYPNLKVHGVFREHRGALEFDGVHTCLQDNGTYSGTFITMPSLDSAGLTFAVKLKYNLRTVQSSDEKFIVDTGGWMGHGVSLFVSDGYLTAAVGSKGRVWVAQTSDTAFTFWSFVLITWREDMGLLMYINGALAAKEKSYQYLIEEFEPFNGLTIGCSVLKGSPSFAKFQLAMVTFSPTFTTIDELMKYSPPLVLRATFDWYLMLIENGTTLTSPPLKVNGDVMATENGISLDGRNGYLNVGTLQDSSEENAEIICEHYQKDITCPQGQLIKLTYANYGRTSDIPCQGKRKYITTNCKSKKSFSMAKSLCDGPRACRLKSLNSVWGNPCPGVIKYLDVRYQCVGEKKRDNSSQYSAGAHFLTNPGLSKKGMTIAMKVRLNKDADQYVTPHYIVDSGGQYGNGVSIYVMTKKLFCVISSRNKAWEVNTPVSSDAWLFILVTWSKEQGLALYVNGVLKAATISSTIMSVSRGTVSAGLVIGKSLADEPNSFTRFHISLFTVLKSYISKSESYRVFSYHIGRAITNVYEVSSLNQDTVFVCEYQSRTISCPVDQVIEIVYANFGRTSTRPCAWGTHHETNCTLPSAIVTARDRCNNKNSCELVAKNSMWKLNPCPGIIKYVEVKYICNQVAPSAVTKTTYIAAEDPNSLVIP